MRSIILLCLAFLSIEVSAGGVDGGGGKALVCRDGNGAITRAEVLDLYEGQIMYGTSYVESTDAFESQMIAAFRRLDSSKAIIYQIWSEDIIKSMRILPPDTKLLPVDDSLEIIAPKHCTFEQAANFYNQNVILIDGEIWAAFSPTQKAALIAHETIYFDARLNGSKDSRRSRNIVAHAFTPAFKAVDIKSGVPANAKYCYGNLNDHNPMTPPKTEFFFFEDPNAPGEMIMQFTLLDGRPMVTKTIISLRSNNYEIDRAWEERHGDTRVGAKIFADYNTQSILESDDITIVTSWDPVVDNRTKQTVPGVHYLNYYMWGKSTTEPNTSYAEMFLGCYTIIKPIEN